MALRWIHVALVVLSFSIAERASADWLYRMDTGVFNGRIARTQSGNTIPFNAPMGIYVGGEFQMWRKGGWLRGLLGTSYYDFKGKSVSATDSSTLAIGYGDVKIGAVIGTTCCEWRLLYSMHQTPYTELPTVNSIQTGKASISYLRAEAILYAKALKYRLAFYYFLAHALNHPEISTGQIDSNYFLGGCARILLGEKFRWGPSICIDLQEMNFPQSTVVFRQEVHGRLAFEF